MPPPLPTKNSLGHNPKVQKAAGDATARAASDPNAQKRAGDAAASSVLASTSKGNPLQRAAGKGAASALRSRGVQKVAGKGVAVAARDQRVQQAAAEQLVGPKDTAPRKVAPPVPRPKTAGVRPQLPLKPAAPGTTAVDEAPPPLPAKPKRPPKPKERAGNPGPSVPPPVLAPKPELQSQDARQVPPPRPSPNLARGSVGADEPPRRPLPVPVRRTSSGSPDGPVGRQLASTSTRPKLPIPPKRVTPKPATSTALVLPVSAPRQDRPGVSFDHASVYLVSCSNSTVTRDVLCTDVTADFSTSETVDGKLLSIAAGGKKLASSLPPTMSVISPRSREYLIPIPAADNKVAPEFTCYLLAFDNKELMPDKSLLVLVDEILLSRNADMVMRGHTAVHDTAALHGQQGLESKPEWRRARAIRAINAGDEPAGPDGVQLLGCEVDDEVIVFELEERSDGWALCEVWSESDKRWLRGVLPADAITIVARTVSDNERLATKAAHHTATGVAAGGRAIGSGIAAGGRLLSRGMSKGTDDQLKRKKSVVAPATGPSVEHQQNAAKGEKASSAFLSGSRKAVLGFQKGTTKLGHGISNGVKSTDTYKIRQERTKYDEASAAKCAAIGVGKASVSAVGSIFHGVKDGAVITAASARDNRVRYIEETQGKAAADAARAKFNSAGNAAVGTYNVVSIASSVSTGKWLLHAGIAGVVGDPRQQMAIGGSWWPRSFIGDQSPMTPCVRAELQDWALQSIWHERHLSLKALALVYYDRDVSGISSQPGPTPDGFVSLEDILKVEYPYKPSPAGSKHTDRCVAFSTRDRAFVFAFSSPELAQSLVAAVSVMKTTIGCLGYA